MAKNKLLAIVSCVVLIIMLVVCVVWDVSQLEQTDAVIRIPWKEVASADFYYSDADEHRRHLAIDRAEASLLAGEISSWKLVEVFDVHPAVPFNIFYIAFHYEGQKDVTVQVYSDLIMIDGQGYVFAPDVAPDAMDTVVVPYLERLLSRWR